MTITAAKKLFGKNFIGQNELKKIGALINLAPTDVPDINFEDDILKKKSKTALLILGQAEHKNGQALTINSLRDIFGFDPEKKKPCFYNQDWYINHKFANVKTLDNKWYLIEKAVSANTRAKAPEELVRRAQDNQNFPSAVLTAYTFFCNYLINEEILWKNDFIWCSDVDDSGDQIYTGRYEDPTGKNKKGFNIHRHLKIRRNYGAVWSQ